MSWTPEEMAEAAAMWPETEAALVRAENRRKAFENRGVAHIQRDPLGRFVRLIHGGQP